MLISPLDSKLTVWQHFWYSNSALVVELAGLVEVVCVVLGVVGVLGVLVVVGVLGVVGVVGSFS